MAPSDDPVAVVDVGTSAVRAALVATDGTTLAAVRRARVGEVARRFDAERLWHDLVAVLRELTADRPRIAALAMAGHVGAVAVDAAGVPVAPAGGWADDRGLSTLDGETCRAAGRPAPAGGALPLLRALPTEPHLLLSPKDFLALRLTGRAATDPTSAAYTMAFDVRARRWSAALGADASRFPPVHPATDTIGAVTPDAAAATGLPAGLPVLAGGPDGTVGIAAVAGTRTGVVVDVAGTTDVLARLCTEPGTAPGAVLNPYLVSPLWTVGGPTGMTGGAVSALATLTGLGPLDRLPAANAARIEAVPAGSDGLFVVPSLSGSRFPDWRPAERGAVLGLTAAHRAEHVVHAAHEAAAYLVRTALDRIACGNTDPVLLGGGAARTPWLAQLRADVLGRPVLVCREPDVSLRGAAMLALVGAGRYPDLAAAHHALAPETRTVTPDPARATRYAELYPRWQTRRDALHRPEETT
jgi:xylulokinase